MRYYFRYSFLFFLLLSMRSFAIDWSEGLKIVTANNPEIIAAKSILKASQFQESAAHSGFYPKISAAANSVYNTVTTNSVSINASENLFSGFQDQAKSNSAKFTKEGQEANLNSVLAKVSYDYKSAFTNLIYAQKNISLSNDIISRRQANLKLVQLRFESGRENIGSLHLSKAYLADAKYNYLIATNSLSVAQLDLSRVLGTEEPSNLSVSGIVPVSDPTNTNLNFKELTISTPEFHKALSAEKVSLVAIDSAKSGFYPNFNLTQSAIRSSKDSAPWNSSWSVGAELTFSLFNGGQDYYTYKSSHEVYRSNVMNKKNIQDTGMVKLKDTFAKYQEAVLKLEVDQAFVEASMSRERIAKEKYNNGLLTFDEWDIVENDLILRQKELVLAERNRVIAEALWEQVQGVGVIK